MHRWDKKNSAVPLKKSPESAIFPPTAATSPHRQHGRATWDQGGLMVPDRVTLADLFQRAERVGLRPRSNSSGFTCLCPAHDDRQRPSLSVGEGEDGKVLFRCFAGCTFDAIAEAFGVRPAQLFPDPGSAGVPPACGYRS